MKLLGLALATASLFSGVIAESRCTPGHRYCGSVLISRGMCLICLVLGSNVFPLTPTRLGQGRPLPERRLLLFLGSRRRGPKDLREWMLWAGGALRLRS